MREKSWFREYGLILAAGVAVGIAALILTASGNPKNMGFCIACFLRDIAGALGLHSAANVQYIRPRSSASWWGPRRQLWLPGSSGQRPGPLPPAGLCWGCS